jgi:glucose/arabinose dehydrogenase
VKSTRRSLQVVLLFGSIAVVAASTFAHPPFAPFDDTRFAPITRFGPSISVQVVAATDPSAPPETALVAPNKGVAAPGLAGHLFIVDQPGKIWAVNFNTIDPATELPQRSLFLDVGPLLVTLGVCGPDTFDERGLLGLAFHPQFATNRKFYTYTSEPNSGPPTFPTTVPGVPDHQNVVTEWKAVNASDPTAGVEMSSRRQLMKVDWPQFNHDGGDLAFGPDGFLYISMGDGGGADDRDGQLFVTAPPHHPVCGEAPITGHGLDGNAQKLTNPLGKILRIDVDGSNSANGQYGIPSNNPFVRTAGAVKEIYAFGFRNPFRFSFDRRGGDLYTGDVGQNDIEEVNIVVRGGNYGWRHKEGTLFFHHNENAEGFASRQPPAGAVIPSSLRDPIAQYDTHHEGHSAIGGFVYRGRAIADLVGRYVFGDFALLFKFPLGPHDYGRLFWITPGGNGLRPISQIQVLPGNALSLALLGLGEDAAGEIYATGNISGVPFGSGGRVLRLVPVNTDID